MSKKSFPALAQAPDHSMKMIGLVIFLISHEELLELELVNRI